MLRVLFYSILGWLFYRIFLKRKKPPAPVSGTNQNEKVSKKDNLDIQDAEFEEIE